MTVALLVVACTPSTQDARPSAETAGSASPAPPAPSAPASPTPRTLAPETLHRPPPRQPVVLAVHANGPTLSVSTKVARRILSGRVDSWAALGGRSRPLTVIAAPGTPTSERIPVRDADTAIRRVIQDASVLAVVPAGAMRASVQAVAVDQVDPLRQPAAYPLTMPADHKPGPVVTVSVVGDIMLGREVGRIAAAAGDPALQLRPMQERLASADITVGNLESTLSTAGAPTQGGDSFAAPPAVRAGLADAGFDVLGLANNHLGDYGDAALVETVRLLRSAGFATFGAGATLAEARRPVIVHRSGIRFGFLGFNAIGETPAAGPDQPGAVSIGMPPRTGPLDEDALGAFLQQVRRLDRRVDVVVVLPHWGTQYTHRPEPMQHRVATRLVDAGADLVVGGHPHWVQGAEMVQGRLVVHSLGNFVFDMDFMQQTQEGVLLELTYWGDRLVAADLVPYRMDARFAPRVLRDGQGRSILELMGATSGPAWSPR